MLTQNIEQFRAEIERHIEADALVQCSTGHKAGNAVGYRGCFIVCTAGGKYSAKVASKKYGLPLPVIRLAEHIHDNLPEGEHVTFFRDFGAAVAVDGKDLSLIYWKFLADELRELPKVPEEVQSVIDPIIAGVDLLASGGDWPKDQSRAAADAAYIYADACAYAACADAAYADAYAAYAASHLAAHAAPDRLTAIRRQRDTLLRLIREAPVTRGVAA